MNNDLISRSKAIEELNYLKHIGYETPKHGNTKVQICEVLNEC